ncbi:redox-active disulfide protein 2 [Elizabethkingia meningoseptica]|uniref:redox-active disulfide protein 2 n=1 Tax=Elizabethkingia TaxID=308865 RepID=UPI000987A740|nr:MULTISPECIES: redox-active disulfide protein 2 [Elizabethkingia]EJK5327625.1 redox-active disulfide protein 2 [Elizabethkingia meningoseptica]MBG0515124.1 redox-active disulfide protein 2 [Elizabethkingia meningoseptica]MDE5429569.1 redox-active disulfide protein 2 [Elizabethkingia meningoseptica]MDE5434376.1 redox-active disulfide protein 2 [Elizabethkingia meningoseptica]MDE5436507.1 redox-active disulfide protein 2 [Elizabethkingia meningoseptica]
MKKENWSSLSTEDLNQKQKSIKSLTTMLIVTLIALFLISLFISLKKGFTPLLVIPIALLPVVSMNLNNLKNIKKEIDSRNN